MAKQYLNATINNSATIRGKATAAITNAAHKAVAFDANGGLILPASAGAVAVGVVLSDPAATEDASDNLITAAGAEIDVAIKDITFIEASAAISAGAAVAVTTTGAAVTADEGNFILGYAMTAAAEAGELIQIQITKSGFVPVTPEEATP